ncbi:MAG: anaerobic ribonucleoside-triphosphate reductase [Candidatus Altiarchaeota archaeon]
MKKNTKKTRKPLLVRTSSNRLEPFDKQKIEDSLVTETRIDRAHAKKIADQLEKDLSRLNVKYLTAPLIREIVNVKLLEKGFESARMRYTRLGMPVYDTKKLIAQGIKDNICLQHNPETVHHLMGDVVAREYTYVHLLPPKLVDQHMSGRIHIHDLNFFATRPFAFSHDLRFFLKNGLKVDGSGLYSPVAGPPKKPDAAFLQAARILSASQKNCSGGSSLPFFNAFLAPYVRGLKYDEIKQLAQLFIYELSQIYPVGGKETVFPSINLNLTIPEYLSNVPAVVPSGKISDRLCYGDYEGEAQSILLALTEVFIKGDYAGRPFPFPQLEIHVEKGQAHALSNVWLKLTELSAKFGSPSYIYHNKKTPKIFSYQTDTNLIPLAPRNRTPSERSLMTGGILQVATLNLPRMALEAKCDEGRILSFISKSTSNMKAALLIKKDINESNLKNNLLPFLGQKPPKSRKPYFNPENQYMVFSFLGLSETVKIITGSGMHQDPSAKKLGLTIISDLADIVREYKTETGFNFSLSGSSRTTTAARMAEIDSQNFDMGNIYQRNPKTGRFQYTPSFQLPLDAETSTIERLEIESQFHEMLDGGCISRFTLKADEAKPEEISELLTGKVQNTPAQHLSVTPHK